MKIGQMVWQGDISIERIEKLPEGLVVKKDKILVYGESTGHSHRISEGLVYEKEKVMCFETFIPTSIEHEEHDPKELPGGVYKIERQREYKSGDMTALIVD